MKRYIRALLGLTGLGLLGPGAAHAQGLYWESTTTGVGPNPRIAQFYAMPKMFKEVTSDGKVTLLRTDQDKMITIDPNGKTYREMKFADLEKAAQAAQGQMKEAMAKMQEHLKDMPAEQRAMMEKMMPQMSGAAAQPVNVTVKNTGETKSVAGHPCTKYVASEGDKTVLIAWTTKDLSGFDTLRTDWLTLQQRMAALNRAGSGVAEAYRQIQGFPMETEIGKVKTVVTKVEPRTTPASEFEIPPGFKQLPSELPHVPPHP